MKEVLTEEERRRRRNEASRRCYLKRKAAQAAAQAAKNPKPKARAVEAKPAPRPAPKKGDPVAMAEKVVKKFAKTAAGVKPMLAEAAELLKAVYPAADQKTAEKVERVLAKGLGVGVSRLASDPITKIRVCLDAVSRTIKTPAFRLAKPAEEPVEEPAEENAQFVPFPDPDKLEDEDPEPAEVPLDPETIEKIDAGEIAAEDAVKGFDDEDKDEDEEEDETDEEDEDKDEDETDEEDEDKDEDEDDEEDEDARRERDERRIDDDWASGRWDMMREMDAQGSFDD